MLWIWLWVAGDTYVFGAPMPLESWGRRGGGGGICMGAVEGSDSGTGCLPLDLLGLVDRGRISCGVAAEITCLLFGFRGLMDRVRSNTPLA